jgi:ribosomal protein S18 acetylase RimI-like enzyme
MEAWMTEAPLEFLRVSARHERPLARFFETLAQNGDERWFHPHPLSAAHAAALAVHAGRDLYYVATRADAVCAYGLLRGWDEGYTTPSLGIAVHPDARGCGLARAFMLFLHAAARLQGARRIRLKVYPANTAARQLYQSLGYRFEPTPDAQLLGLCDLERRGHG